MTQTFKQYLTETVKITKKDAEISDEDFEVIKATARAMIKGGYAGNYLKMTTEGEYFVRGSAYVSTLVGNKAQKTGKSVIGIVEPPRAKDRMSTFSKNQFIYNVWHLLGMPSRKRATMATTNIEMASHFGDVFIFIPKDGTEIFYIDEDWNVGFKDKVEKVFGRRIRFGDLSYVFKGFTRMRVDGIRRYTSDFINFNTQLVEYEEQLTYLCHELDLVLQNTEISDIMNVIEQHDNLRCMVNILNLVQLEGKTTLGLLKDLMQSIKSEIHQSTDVTKVLHESRSNPETELWWSGGAFALRLKQHKELRELESVVRQMIGEKQ